MKRGFNNYLRLACCLSVLFFTILFVSGPTLAQDSKIPAQTDESKTAEQEIVNARIVVNVPAYKLLFYQGDKLVKTFPVAIGSRDFSSPYGVQRKALQLVWNPSWTPPSSDWARGEKAASPGASSCRRPPPMPRERRSSPCRRVSRSKSPRARTS